MTNKDLIDTLATYGEKPSKEKEKKKSKTPPELPIEGPKAPKLQQPNPFTPPDGDGGKGVYPDIYGPDYKGTPGMPFRDDEPCNTCNLDLQVAFPSDGAPQPFLTDFSKFQK